MPDQDPGSDPRRSAAVSGTGLIALAILGAALILSWGSNDEPRYQLVGSGAGVVRMNTDSGEMIACDMRQCARIQPPDRSATFGPIGVVVEGTADKTAERQSLEQQRPAVRNEAAAP